MSVIEPFSSQQIEAVSRVLADTNDGLTVSERLPSSSATQAFLTWTRPIPGGSGSTTPLPGGQPPQRSWAQGALYYQVLFRIEREV